MRRKLVPLVRRHAVQTKVAVVVDRTVYWATLILMYVGSDKGRLGRPYRSGEHPRDAIRAVIAHEQTVALPFVLFQKIDAKESFSRLSRGCTVRWKAPHFSPGIIIAPEPMPTYFVTPAAFMASQTCGR